MQPIKMNRTDRRLNARRRARANAARRAELQRTADGMGISRDALVEQIAARYAAAAVRKAERAAAEAAAKAGVSL